jgi:uncharacterized membrane protein affecting hemolysin expression
MDEDRYTRITLRIPTDLHTKLQQSADKASHSMNAEIIMRLVQTYEAAQRIENRQLDELAELLAEKVAQRLLKKK